MFSLANHESMFLWVRFWFYIISRGIQIGGFLKVNIISVHEIIIFLEDYS